MTHAQLAAIRLCIVEALNGKWFDICGVFKAAEVLGVLSPARTPDWALLKALHMKRWTDMDAETREEVVATVARVLGIEPSAVRQREPSVYELMQADGTVPAGPKFLPFAEA